MTARTNTTNQDKINKVLKSLQVVRRFQSERQIYGVARVNRYVEDVDSDWLENWGEDEENIVTETKDN